MTVRSLLYFATGCLAASANCPAPSPVSVPITNVALSDGNTMRGIYMPVGSPAQNLSFQPAHLQNDTWVYNTSAADATCPEDSPLAQCITTRGGLFDTSVSTTFEERSNVFAAGGSDSVAYNETNGAIEGFDWAVESLSVGDLALEKFPIGMPPVAMGSQYHPQHYLGLGANSTFLNALKDAGDIASRSFGFWWGLDGATESSQMDGAIVFGGYDAAKATGNNMTMDLVPPTSKCPSGMQITIADIRLQFPNGTASSIEYPSTALGACIRMDFPATVTMPTDPYYNNFMRDTETFSYGRSWGINWLTALFDPEQVFQGAMSIDLEAGESLSITVPNDLLVIPERSIDSEGAVTSNTSVSDLLVWPLVEDNVGDVSLLGTTFLSSAYLFVNFDAGTWTLWAATATEDSDLVTVGPDCADAHTDSTPTGATDDGEAVPTSGAGDDTSDETEEGSSVSTGAIAGAAVGGAVGALMIAASVFLLCRWRRRRHVQGFDSNVALTDAETRYDEHTDEAYAKGYGRAELDEQGVVEVPGYQQHPHEADSRSGPAEMGPGVYERYELPGHRFSKARSTMRGKLSGALAEME